MLLPITLTLTLAIIVSLATSATHFSQVKRKHWKRAPAHGTFNVDAYAYNKPVVNLVKHLPRSGQALPVGRLLEQIALSSRVSEVPRTEYRNLDSSRESTGSMDPASLAALNSELAQMQMNLKLYSHEFHVQDKGKKKIVIINTLGGDKQKESVEKSPELEKPEQQSPLNLKLALPERWADEVATSRPKPDNSNEVLTNTRAISPMKAQLAKMETAQELDKLAKLPDDSKKRTNDATTIEMASTTAERGEQLKSGQQSKTIVNVNHVEVEGLQKHLGIKRGQMEEHTQQQQVNSEQELGQIDGQANEEGQQQVELQEKLKMEQSELQQIDRPLTEVEQSNLKKQQGELMREEQEKLKKKEELQQKLSGTVEREQTQLEQSQVMQEQMREDPAGNVTKAEQQIEHPQQLDKYNLEQQKEVEPQEQMLKLDQLKKQHRVEQQQIEKQTQMKEHQTAAKLEQLMDKEDEKLEPVALQLQPNPKPDQNVADAHVAAVDAAKKDDSQYDNDGPAAGMNMSGEPKLESKPEAGAAGAEPKAGPTPTPVPAPAPAPTRKLMTSVGQTADVKATTEISSQDKRQPMPKGQKGHNGKMGQKAAKGKGKRRPTDEQEIETTTNWWQILPYAEIRKFLNTIYDSIADDDDANDERAQRMRTEAAIGALE
ncbi:trichohyalin [Drosophila navojoa]|uniref:trichohyalin n=1 Tax=Drosophila navojoa TaxID=7232 RepID=UPI000846A61F|nr:trichohyalin [Drosophila navojoa]